MKRRTAASLLSTALVLGAGVPSLAQDAQPRPETAPGVEVERVNSLMVGDRAPELAIGEWVKGDPVSGFEEGKVYVVEFWATWCGPCIAGMPHISELQEKHRDKGLTVIGVNIWDEPDKVAPFMEDRGVGRDGKKNPTGDELMDYTVAIEKKIEDGDIRNGEMAINWMKAAGRRGIPSAFIVDQRGYIAWMGHPMQMDEPLEQVIAGEWDLAEAAREHVVQARNDKLMADMGQAFREGDMQAATSLATKVVDRVAWDNASMLNYIAWNFVDPDKEIENRPTALAIKAAERAAQLTDHNQASILDTLAWAYYHAGMKDKAIKTQTKAVELAPPAQKAGLEASLERMKK